MWMVVWVCTLVQWSAGDLSRGRSLSPWMTGWLKMDDLWFDDSGNHHYFIKCSSTQITNNNKKNSIKQKKKKCIKDRRWVKSRVERWVYSLLVFLISNCGVFQSSGAEVIKASPQLSFDCCRRRYVLDPTGNSLTHSRSSRPLGTWNCAYIDSEWVGCPRQVPGAFQGLLPCSRAPQQCCEGSPAPLLPSSTQFGL